LTFFTFSLFHFFTLSLEVKNLLNPKFPSFILVKFGFQALNRGSFPAAYDEQESHLDHNRVDERGHARPLLASGQVDRLGHPAQPGAV
jgi:hypothetical protein